jgi:hypothetical protein
MNNKKPKQRRAESLIRLMSVAAFDFELREGVGQRGIDDSGLFIIEVFGKAGFRAPTCFLGLGLVNILRLNGHVRQDGDPFASDLNKAFAHGQEQVPAVFADSQFAGDDLRQYRDVLRIDAHLPFCRGQRDHLDILGVSLGVGSDDFQF